MDAHNGTDDLREAYILIMWLKREVQRSPQWGDCNLALNVVADILLRHAGTMPQHLDGRPDWTAPVPEQAYVHAQRLKRLTPQRHPHKEEASQEVLTHPPPCLAG